MADDRGGRAAGGRGLYAKRLNGWLDIASLVLIAPAVVGGVYWGVVLYHVLRTRWLLPTARAGMRLAEAGALRRAGAPRLCVVIPAHNEAGSIGPLAESLREQTYGNLRVVFALDRCTDDTAGVLLRIVGDDGRFEILTIDSCPGDWAGKVNAVWRGVRESVGARGGGAAAELLLFIDADTAMHPECLVATVALLQNRGLGMLSLLSTMTHDRWFEKVVQPAAGMELMRQYPLLRANMDAGRRAFANGQFILMTAEAYGRIGGHEAARGALLEDVEIARLCERHGVPAGVLLADGMHLCRMYGSYAEFVRGWKRIYVECANRRISRLRKLARRTRWLGAVVPALMWAGLGVGVFGMLRVGEGMSVVLLYAAGVSLGLMLLTLGVSYRMGHTPLRHVLSYPVGAWLTGGILERAARDLESREPTVWAGREYVREAR